MKFYFLLTESAKRAYNHFKQQKMIYKQALLWIHQVINPDKYVEIGVAKGVSPNVAEYKSIGIDPSPEYHSKTKIKKDI